MSNITANGIQIEYDTFGAPSAPPILLIMGLGAQMIAWHEGFCELLAAKGHYVIRFDNRDVGLSTKFEAAGVPNIMQMRADAAEGKPIQAPYLLSDMAADAAGLLDALKIDAAHIVGASLGGMVAQQFVIDHPQRTLTLTSIMSTTGNPELPAPKPEAIARLLTPAPMDREGNIAYRLATAKIIGSLPELIDEAFVLANAARAYDRAFYPAGTVRQMVAVTASPNRKSALANVKAPTLVIHGEIDPLVPLTGGIDTHEAIAGSELLVVPKMGHDQPKSLWPTLADAIAKNTAKVGVTV